MTITDGIYGLLSGNAALAALVGTAIYPVRLPAGSAMPAITFHRVGGVASPTLTTEGLQKVRLQIDCFGATLTSADAVRDAVRQALDRASGTLSDGTYLQDAQLIQMVDFDDQDALQFRCMSEFYLYFNFTS